MEPKSANNRVNLTAGTSAAFRGNLIGVVRLPKMLDGIGSLNADASS